MASIKKLCKKCQQKEGYKSLKFQDMIRLAERWGQVIRAKKNKFGVYYPAEAPSPSLFLEKPHGNREDVPEVYKKKFVNMFAEEIDREAS